MMHFPGNILSKKSWSRSSLWYSSGMPSTNTVLARTRSISRSHLKRSCKNSDCAAQIFLWTSTQTIHTTTE